MKLAAGILTMFLVFVEFGEAQTNGSSINTERLASVPEAATENYAVFGATSSREAALRTQIRLVHPEVLPLRVLFVPALEVPGQRQNLSLACSLRVRQFDVHALAQPDPRQQASLPLKFRESLLKHPGHGASGLASVFWGWENARMVYDTLPSDVFHSTVGVPSKGNR